MTENIFEAFTVSGFCLVWRIYQFGLDKALRESYICFPHMCYEVTTYEVRIRVGVYMLCIVGGNHNKL